MTRIADDIKRETILKSRVFDVQRRTYDLGGGKTLLREFVVHPGAVVIVPRLDDGRFVMIRNMRRPVEEELLELAAGTREPSEKPIETAARELEEETGYQAGRIEPFIEFYTSPGFCTERMHRAASESGWRSSTPTASEGRSSTGASATARPWPFWRRTS